MHSKVRFFSTHRYSLKGISEGNYASSNIALHTGDDKERVHHNRTQLVTQFDLPTMPKWLNQTHSTLCLTDRDEHNNGDSIITTRRHKVLAVFTADCLPIFAFDNAHTIIGVAHAGWQGLYDGVLENFIRSFVAHSYSPQDLTLYFGTALGQQNFEVSEDFCTQFVHKRPEWKSCFTASSLSAHKYQFNIYDAANIVALEMGVCASCIHTPKEWGQASCAYASTEHFSYRRDGQHSGRQAHIIYLDN